MRRLLFIVVSLFAVITTASAAGAARPEREHLIEKNVTQTVPLVEGCPSPAGATSIDIVFNSQSHAVFPDDETFHLTSTQTGTFVVRSGSGAALASGHFTAHFSAQGPGFPILTVTDRLKATGRTVDGERVNIHLAFHLTVNANGEVTVEAEHVRC